MADEMDEFPGILSVSAGTTTPSGHGAEADSVLNDEEQLAVRLPLGGGKPHVRRGWIGVASHRSIATAIVRMASSAVVGPVRPCSGEHLFGVGFGFDRTRASAGTAADQPARRTSVRGGSVAGSVRSS